MTHAVKLHTHGPRTYRGKYPTRMRMFSNGGLEAPIVAKHLDIRSPHFVELNNGDRYYIDGFYLSTFKLPTQRPGLGKIDWAPIVANHTELNPFGYNRMLLEIFDAREADKAARVKARNDRIDRMVNRGGFLVDPK